MNFSVSRGLGARRTGRVVSLGCFLGVLGMVAVAGANPLVGGGSAHAGLSWTRESPATSPPRLAGMTLAYDPSGGYIVGYGGGEFNLRNGTDTPLYETWIYSGGTWTRAHTVTAPPSPRGAFSFDTASGQAVYFGGWVDRVPGMPQDGIVPTNETWAFANGNWTELHPSVAPPRPDFALLAYDPSSRGLVLYDSGYNGYGRGNDSTWLFKGGNWTLLASPPAAPMVDPTGMVYDPGLHAMLLVGFKNYSNDMRWGVALFQNGHWSAFQKEKKPTWWSELTPDALDSQRVVYDSLHSAPLLVTVGNASLHVLEYRSGAWTELPVFGAIPAARESFGLAYDQHDGRVVLFGGDHPDGGSGTGPYFRDYDQTWAFG